MLTVDISEFKQKCLVLLDVVEWQEVLITKNGKPFARLILAESNCAELIGSMKGKIQVRGDIMSTGSFK